MAKSLVIVESPAKARTLERFLGRGYEVAASMGHVRDLPRSQLGVDVEGGFTPKYITIRGKGPIVTQLRERARRAGRVLLATDPDREGEAISWHLCNLLGLPEDAPVRIAFHEITQDAVKRALSAPRPIDRNLVDAQQARRVLDRLVGYQLSPLLWRKVRGGLSAGRVQSVAVRLIVDREREIQAFRPEEYWTLTAPLALEGQGFRARFWGTDGERRQLASREETDAVVAEVTALTQEGQDGFVVARVQKRERRRNPAPPFTTATLQQEAARKLGFTVRRTMRLAQELYEGLSVGGAHVGLITYMRTDSIRVAASAVAEAQDFVRNRWGDAFSSPRQGSAAAGAQDAHEGIRPTSVLRTPESLAHDLSRDQLRLYRLIWERFVASQMAPAVLDTVTADIRVGRHTFRASGSTVKFPGFTVLYVEGRDEGEGAAAPQREEEEPEQATLPEMVQGQRPQLQGPLIPAQHFTEPPPRYSEAMLVRALEEKGIGRPSTYATIIETITARGYVRREQRRFYPTELGFVVTDLLREHFPDVVDVAFTAGMERDLDAIETGRPWQGVLAQFYGPFASALQRAEENIGTVTLPEEKTDEVCPTCGQPMVVRRGRFGPFLACSAYPACKTTRPILERTGVVCPRCRQGQLVVRRSRRGRTFYGCERYPECDFVLWERPVGSCPVCEQPMVEKRGRHGAHWRQCVNPECGHREGAGGEGEMADGGGEGRVAAMAAPRPVDGAGSVATGTPGPAASPSAADEAAAAVRPGVRRGRQGKAVASGAARPRRARGGAGTKGQGRGGRRPAKG
jgi:DNA topoisomerase-1